MLLEMPTQKSAISQGKAHYAPQNNFSRLTEMPIAKLSLTWIAESQAIELKDGCY
jgi:hypothetical protein